MDTSWDSKLYNEKHSFVSDYGASLVDLLNPKDNETILDLGCGTGQLTALIGERAKQVIGMDKSLEMVQSAQSQFPKLDFQTGDAAAFNFDLKFDSIFSNAALHWVTDYKSVIACMYDNLAERGKIVLEFGGKGNVQSIVNQLRLSLRQRGYIVQSELHLWYFPSIAEYSNALEAVGFEVTFAQLFERPTELADETTGIKDWILMFGKAFFIGVRKEDIVAILAEVQHELKSKLFKNGKWYADYKRLRIIAKK
jgi:trans-aconitate methyltransferase